MSLAFKSISNYISDAIQLSNTCKFLNTNKQHFLIEFGKFKMKL